MSASNPGRPFVIGVTGNIACGKSAVVALLAEKGAGTIDSDRVYHALIQPGEPLWERLRDHFGPEVISNDGSIDRRALGAIVFSDPARLADLDALTHPAVVQAVRTAIANSHAPVVAIDAVKLVESGMAADCDSLWLIECAPDVQLHRLMVRNGFSEQEAARRIAAQPDLTTKRLLADEIIDNSGDISETRRQVDAAWARLPILSS